MTLTFTKAAALARAFGFTIRREVAGESGLVVYAKGTGADWPAAYFTDCPEDALRTACHMAATPLAMATLEELDEAEAAPVQIKPTAEECRTLREVARRETRRWTGRGLREMEAGIRFSLSAPESDGPQLAAFILTTGSDSTGPAYLAEAVAEAVDKRGKPDYRGEPGAAAQVAAVFARVLGLGAGELGKELQRLREELASERAERVAMEVRAKNAESRLDKIRARNAEDLARNIGPGR